VDKLNACKTCGFELYNPIEDDGILVTSNLGLYNDGRFPGRCILSLFSHATELIKLDPDHLSEFMWDVQAAGKAVQEATGADRINYAILGNAEPHVHCHIIPRVFEDDPNPKSTPWSRDDKAWEMSQERCQEIMKNIRSHLRRIGE
tara:strand:- start:752 stop:1189 length:438 start_codon:yes stop_codon:yes gene_type:complete